MKTKGFTLIEIIVVIGIIAVLAVILIPSMIAYTKESKMSTANTNAKLAFENAATYYVQCQSGQGPVAQGNYNAIPLRNDNPDTDYSRDGNHLADALQALMGANGNKSGFASVKISEKGLPEDARWALTETDLFVGSYPNRTNSEGELPLLY